MRMFLISVLIILSFANVFVLWPMVMFFTGWTGHWAMVSLQLIFFALMVWVADGTD